MIERRLADLLAPHGLVVFGGFHPGPADGAPAGIATLVLVGNGGGAMWPAFSAARRDEPDPLDGWTRRVLDAAARDTGARVLYPFAGPPFHPFQRWARTALIAHPSPIGPLVHPEYGLWHAYRGAFAFADRREIEARPPAPGPCETCADRPCLSACPVDAFTDTGYDVPACLGHVAGTGGGDCRTGGCRARRACPVGAAYRYGPDQAAFHMVRFQAAHGRPG